MFVEADAMVYTAAQGTPLHRPARAALARYGGTETLCLSRQILRTAVAVLTRPKVRAKAAAPLA